VRAAARRPAWELACAGAIVVAAAWLRLGHLGLMEFKQDEATAVEIGRAILHGHLTTTGLTSSVGAKNPPLFVYVAALALAIWNDPRSIAGFVALAAVVAVALTYTILRPRFGALAALTAAALFATAPWAVLYGHKIWAQDLLPIVTVLLLWSLFVLLERSRSRLVLFVPILLSLTVQLNFSALALVVPVLLVVVYRWRHVNWLALLAGVGVVLLLLSPWLVHDAKHHFSDVTTLAKSGRGEGSPDYIGQGAIEAVRQTVYIVSAGNWGYVAGPSRVLLQHEAGWEWTVGRIAGFVSVGGCLLGMLSSLVVIGCRTRLRRGWPFVLFDLDAERRLVLLVWILGIWLSYVDSTRDRVLPHYLIAIFPIPFVLAGLGISDVASLARGRAARPARLAAYAAAAAVAIGFLAFDTGFTQFLQHRGGTDGDYGVVYHDKAALAAAARRDHLGVYDVHELQWLATGSFDTPPGQRLVTVLDRLTQSGQLPCTGKLRTFGALEACFPPSS
jgi:4-amino-4-deoxy-L-arabinose transferase-like glycosyltransferase